MTRRRRIRLVPEHAAEQFEVRATAYFDADGCTYVAVNISEPDDPDARPPLHEVLGVLHMAADILTEQYHRERDEDQ